VVDGFEAMDYMSYPVVLDNLIADGKIGPVIAIFIPPVDRYGEFMGQPYKAFMNAICDELVPLIDRKFRTSPTPAKRGITGISAGGYFALQTILLRHDVFHCGAGQSPTLPDDFQQSFRKFLKSKEKRPPLRVYFDVGRFDLIMGKDDNMTFLKAAGFLHRDMQKAGIEHAFNVYNDGHEWANWRERTDDILIYFWGN
jgi:enterochelin esterase-like enzyme